MDDKRKITVIALGILAIGAIVIALFLPSKSKLGNIDFYVFDTNDNYHYEVNEQLEFMVNDTMAVKGRNLVWQMGNGDVLSGRRDIKYTYRQPGKYLVTLAIDNNYSVNKYIKVISGTDRAAIDSVPRIYGTSEGYQGEELVFAAEGYGMDTWLWEFGESGTVDAYDQQVVYTYETPGEYTVTLQTNTTKYPIKHHITILPRFEKAEETVTVDSITLVQDDIRKHLQAIANAKVSQHGVYYEHVNYIRNKYFCIPADRVAVVVNGEKYNDFTGYCQGLHFLESNSKKHIQIDEVHIDRISCISTIQVTQSYTEK
ncbi:PKD domain-containing protein [Phocaeicola vulgatus]|jgi:hypothetical protein|uniref:PKD domain-containing protein n=2 Tax=Bacteroidaceae TaxID=815 RepID=A0A414HP67_BACT4|nr:MULTISPECIES: PKD domain-containing protein [Bacteroidaceae]AUI45520.1 PKD domain-containing protein [Bacteroides fragilis]MCM0331104.1 PKD domain-containing protein [Bacteroides fragilis]MDB0990911.1 PKD domain-containing protein [Phocaeicola vulgatus]MDB1000260.1 PKD domain-containing protein [Phocaeicola vulgatus]MDB1004795.1 PKD domain-containing protein [Phocaeicola vulgatus]